MVPGGVTEVIWHFAGYLQIINDIARDRLDYDEAHYRSKPDDYTAKPPSYDSNPDLDELDSRGSGTPAIPPLDDLQFVRAHPIKALPIEPVDFDPDLFGGARLPRLLAPSDSGGGGGGPFVITVRYETGGEQSMIQIEQHNIMLDNDNLLGADDAGGKIDAIATKILVDSDAELQRMADDANDHIPQDWWMQQGNSGATDFVTAHDADWAARDGAPDAHSVEPGYYLNGALQTPAPEPPDQTPVEDPAPAPDLGHGLGQWADAGGNISFNAALILDLTESGRTMVVMGDYYKTNAIFQTNTTMDHDFIRTSGGDGTGTIDSGGDKADNIADFVQHPGIYDGLPAFFAGPQWHVDVVDGNYYDIHTVVQMNYLTDNDIVVQNSADTHYEAWSGGNELGNLTQLMDGSVHYDLIIVAGAYHGMNVIFQNNILLNDDLIKMMTDGGVDPSQSVISGQNQLTNTATIENYGDDNFKPVSDNVNSLVTAVGNGSTTLDPSYGQYIDGSGGVFNVLYVKGDYYDVNAIWQTNVTSDVNVIIQLMNQPSQAALDYHPDGTVTQSVVTGQNNLSNDAAIIDVGATNTYVNGQTYGDTILVQANLLPSDKDHVLAQDTHSLVPELIAFVNDGHDDTAAPAVVPVTTVPVQEDPMASMTH